jgi:predicted dehydrogenase
MNRRRFLSATAAGAAFAQTSHPIRTGILGIQHSHLGPKLQALHDNPAYDVVAVAEPDEATRREHSGLPLLQPLRWMAADDIIADKSLDLIVFEGEVRDAVPLGVRVLEAGKHLHLEKPPTNRMEPFRDMVELARRKNLRLQLGYIWRFHAGTDAVLDACRKGSLGDIQMVRCTINADRDLKQRITEARYPGGTMFELGGHMIDRVVALLGRPTRVQHWLRHDTKIDDAEKDNTLAVLEYPSALAIVASTALDAASNRSFEVIGTDGSMLVEPMEPAPNLRIQLRKKGRQEIKLPPQPRFINDFQDLARAIQSGTELKYSYPHELLLHETLLRASGEMS